MTYEDLTLVHSEKPKLYTILALQFDFQSEIMCCILMK